MKRAPIDVDVALAYDHISGVLTWIVSPNRRIRPGSIAGTTGPQGRRYVILNRKRIPSARIAWRLQTGQWPDGDIDHINGMPGDDRFVNLRDVSRKENSQNQRSPRSDNKCGFLGVHRACGKFCASIQVNGKTIHLGRFATAEAAHMAYVEAKRVHHTGGTL